MILEYQGVFENDSFPGIQGPENSLAIKAAQASGLEDSYLIS